MLLLSDRLRFLLIGMELVTKEVHNDCAFTQAARRPQALKRRRQVALDNLLRVKDPDKRQKAEIEVLQKRVGK